ncbi:EPIDERMAL PATTERNING FACTOR-like protein 2 [Euphorbia peplus]|nr:EPIDERMAL PATTERNING FACTOR-like protein 2 [Euphorbia peplus]
MASSSYTDGFKFVTAVTVISVLFFLTVMGGEKNGVEEEKTVLGSKPPGCVNKCLNCRPCMATLVDPSHHQKIIKSFKFVSSHSHDDDNNGYYLLSWKCRCGNKLFQP